MDQQHNMEASARLCAKNLAQKIISPIGAQRISKQLGTLDFFIRGENELRSPKPNNSHFPALIKRPSRVPSSWMIAKAGLGSHPDNECSSLLFHRWYIDDGVVAGQLVQHKAEEHGA